MRIIQYEYTHTLLINIYGKFISSYNPASISILSCALKRVSIYRYISGINGLAVN